MDILGIPVFDRSLESALDQIVATCSDSTAKHSRLISATGAHGLVHAQKDRAFAEVLRSFDLNLPDGLPGVWVGKYFKGAAAMERIRGPDFFREVMCRTAATPIRHYLCGGKEGVATALSVACRDRFGNSNVVGMYSPPFRPMEDADWDELSADIERTGSDIVWIGLSTPKQEVFARELARRIDVHFIATVGAAFDFHMGAAREAPVWIQRSGFEWFYRLCNDPKRLVKRYAEVVPLFLLYNLRDLIREKR